ncbi:MAG: oligosaccharide flippase family protein, partial [Cytophagales bacterium]|nr:oligosaccharide flippase family protein [Cytophagales bacterium]
MSRLARQSFKSTVYIYSGVLFAFVTNTLLFPRYLEPEQIGVLSLLVSYALILSQVANFGIPITITRFYPVFAQAGRQRSFFSLLLGGLLLGGLLSVPAYWLIHVTLIQPEGGLLQRLAFWIWPLALLTAWSYFFDGVLNSVGRNSSLGIFIREFLVRVAFLVALVPLMLGWMGFEGYLTAYSLILMGITPLLAYFAWRARLIAWGPLDRPFLTSERRGVEMLKTSLLGLANGLSLLAIVRIDTIMVAKMLDTGAAGIYVTVMNFAVLITMPSRAVLKPIYVEMAQLLSQGSQQELAQLFRKTSLTLWVVGSLAFLGITCNIHNVERLLPSEYASGMVIIAVLALANLVKMGAGMDSGLIVHSSYFGYNIYLV